jgi:hypothetical protein
LASDAFLTTLHPLLENVLQTVCRKLQEESGTGGFELRAPFSWLEKARNCMGRDLDCMADVLNEALPIHFFQAELRIQFRFLGFSNHQNGASRQEIPK